MRRPPVHHPARRLPEIAAGTGVLTRELVTTIPVLPQDLSAALRALLGR